MVEIRDLASISSGIIIFWGVNAPKKSGFMTMDRVQIEAIKRTKAVLAGFIAGFWPNLRWFGHSYRGIKKAQFGVPDSRLCMSSRKKLKR